MTVSYKYCTEIKTNQYSVTDKIKLRTDFEQGNINGSG